MHSVAKVALVVLVLDELSLCPDDRLAHGDVYQVYRLTYGFSYGLAALTMSSTFLVTWLTSHVRGIKHSRPTTMGPPA